MVERNTTRAMRTHAPPVPAALQISNLAQTAAGALRADVATLQEKVAGMLVCGSCLYSKALPLQQGTASTTPLYASSILSFSPRPEPPAVCQPGPRCVAVPCFVSGWGDTPSALAPPGPASPAQPSLGCALPHTTTRCAEPAALSPLRPARRSAWSSRCASLMRCSRTCRSWRGWWWMRWVLGLI